MKRFLAIAIGGTALAVLFGPRGPLGGFWAPAPGSPQVEGALLAGFISENLVESAALGIGLGILLLGRPWFARRAVDSRRATIGWLATTWLFVSWMPHAALHLHVGMKPAAILPIEWIFHAGSIVAAAALLWAMSKQERVA